MNFHRSVKWQRFSRNRSRRQQKRRRRFERHLKEKHLGGSIATFRRQRLGRQRHVKTYTLIAPEYLSLINNFPDSNEFLKDFRSLLLQRKRIFVDFSTTENLTVEAVLVFLAILKEVGGKKTARKVSTTIGNSPLRHTTAAKLLRESGFYEHVNSDIDMTAPDATRGTIRPRDGTRVSTALADTLTEKAAIAVFGRPKKLPGVYRTFIEVMGNTKQHAGRGEEEERWWAMVHTDPKTHRAEFAFYDGGVGIIGSFRVRLRSTLQALGLMPPEQDILYDLIHGEYKSRTNLPYRGKGLPAIAQAVSRRQIENLKILSNRVVADVANDTVNPLPTEFRGTLIYWELGKKNDNYSNQR
jgi:hypothetical protein